ncbi:unnamed protein product [Prorocentrum cordatum]|uniref:Uncharacterized protein n=2 Tax=Prorocentrum cordatum TaxID=2364126 RepID=A0ABN9TJC7_9DINO|nr:unnamed protein product [Polarella glacialis]
MGTELMIYDLQWELREVYCCCNIHGSGAYVVRAFILHQGKSGYIALPPVTKADDLRLAQPFSAALFKHLPQPWPTLLRDVLQRQEHDAWHAADGSGQDVCLREDVRPPALAVRPGQNSVGNARRIGVQA